MPYLLPLGITAMLDAPLHVGGVLVGVVCHEATGRTAPWTQDERSFAVSIGNLVALLLSKADRVRDAKAIHQQAALLDQAQDGDPGARSRASDPVLESWGRPAVRLERRRRRRVARAGAARRGYSAMRGCQHCRSCAQASGPANCPQRTRTGDAGMGAFAGGRWCAMRPATPRRVLTINTDISERRRLEQQFLRSQRLESIGTMAGGIAHDLNNMLSPISMAVDLLRAEETDPDRLGMFSMIGDSVQRGASMVRQVLSFARGVEGRRVEVSLGEVLRDSLSMARETFPKGIEVQSRVPADLWPVRGDVTQLHQVIMNLCVNARDAMPNGGVLSVSASNATLDRPFPAYPELGEPGDGTQCWWCRTREPGCRPGSWSGSSNRSSPPSPWWKGRGWGCRPPWRSSRATVGTSRSTACRAGVPPFGSTCRRWRALTPPGVVAPRPPPRHGSGELILVVDDEAEIRRHDEAGTGRSGYRVMDGRERGRRAGALPVPRRGMHWSHRPHVPGWMGSS